MNEKTRKWLPDVMGGPDDAADILSGGRQPAGSHSDVMSSGPGQPADVLAGGQEPPGQDPATMAADTPEGDSDVLGGEGR